MILSQKARFFHISAVLILHIQFKAQENKACAWPIHLMGSSVYFLANDASTPLKAVCQVRAEAIQQRFVHMKSLLITHS